VRGIYGLLKPFPFTKGGERHPKAVNIEGWQEALLPPPGAGGKFPGLVEEYRREDTEAWVAGRRLAARTPGGAKSERR